MTVPTLPGFCTPCKRTSRSRVESRASAPTSRKGKTPTGPVGVVSVERRRTSSAAVKSLRGGFFDSRTRLAPSARKSCSASRCFFRSSLAARLSETSGARRLAVARLRFCRFVHVTDGYATVLARALDASEVDAELLGFALGGLGGVDLALLFGGLLHVIDHDLALGAGGLNRLHVHVQLLRPALRGLGSLLLPGRLRSGLSGPLSLAFGAVDLDPRGQMDQATDRELAPGSGDLEGHRLVCAVQVRALILGDGDGGVYGIGARLQRNLEGEVYGRLFTRLPGSERDSFPGSVGREHGHLGLPALQGNSQGALRHGLRVARVHPDGYRGPRRHCADRLLLIVEHQYGPDPGSSRTPSRACGAVPGAHPLEI